MLVVDASIVAPWVLPDEEDPVADAAFSIMQREGALVPELWNYEVYNMIISSERRKRISVGDSEGILLDLSVHSISVGSTDLDRTLMLARRFGLTFYDAAYLELAQRHAIPLATLDRQLADAARQAGIELVAA